MINAEMRLHNYFTLGEKNAYGQVTLPAEDAEPIGQIKIAIFTTTETSQNNVNYKDAKYIGLTKAEVDDTYIIENNKERLKVLYVNPNGIWKQVFMVNI